MSLLPGGCRGAAATAARRLLLLSGPHARVGGRRPSAGASRPVAWLRASGLRRGRVRKRAVQCGAVRCGVLRWGSGCVGRSVGSGSGRAALHLCLELPRPHLSAGSGSASPVRETRRAVEIQRAWSSQSWGCAV